MQYITLYGLKYEIIQTFHTGQVEPTIYGYKAINPKTKQPITFKSKKCAEIFAQRCRAQCLI